MPNALDTLIEALEHYSSEQHAALASLDETIRSARQTLTALSVHVDIGTRIHGASRRNRRGVPERIRSHDVARELGFSLRIVQLMTVAGEIPGALRRKRVWTYDPIQVAALKRRLEAEACRGSLKSTPGSTNAATHSGELSSSPAAAIDEAFERIIGLKPAAGSRRGGYFSRKPK